ncbi:MAG: DUF6768 family protein [Croceibacterium sp.]
MTDIDDAIRAGLDADDRAFLASLDDERGLFRQLGDSLGGPLGGWAKVVFAMTFVLGIMLVASVWQLLTADTTRDQILSATAAMALVMSTGFLKDWLFSRMNMFTVLREVKRLQVQVAMLESKTG